MSSRPFFWPTALLLAGLVLLRAFPFVWWPGTHFDSDQAIVGLMAKHISEARAFPLFYYGQNYMMAVEAYLAAPVMMVAGPTVTALKMPLVVINVAVVSLLLRILVRDARLPPMVAAVAVLPVALPAAGVAARVTEANGGNVEPWLYVLLLWVARDRPWWLGGILGFGMLHREFVVYGAVALLAMDTLSALTSGAVMTRASEVARRWAVAGIAFVTVRGVASVLQPFASGLGPGTTGDDALLLGTVVDTIGGRVCFEPAAWSLRAELLLTDHLPRLIGGVPAPLRDYGVLTGVFSGVSGLGPWVGALTLFGLASGAWHGFTVRRRVALATAGLATESSVGPDRRGAGRAEAAPGQMAHVGGYLVLVGLISTVVYGFATCSDIKVETMRYNLLGVFIPVGALVMALQTWPFPVVRAGLGAAVALWCAVNTGDVVALAREYRTRPPIDQRQAVAAELERRGVTISWSRFRNAYHITFLAQERVRVSANDFARIRSYFDEASLAQAPTLAEQPCADGAALAAGMYLCR
jgi:hypothetical protein